MSLPFYPFFFVLTKSKPAGCCVLAGHVLILGQGWPCVFILPDRMVLFFFSFELICISNMRTSTDTHLLAFAS